MDQYSVIEILVLMIWVGILLLLGINLAVLTKLLHTDIEIGKDIDNIHQKVNRLSPDPVPDHGDY